MLMQDMVNNENVTSHARPKQVSILDEAIAGLLEMSIGYNAQIVETADYDSSLLR